MFLKHKLIVLIIGLLILISAFFIQSNAMFKKSEYSRMQNEIIIFAQTISPYYVNGEIDVVKKMISSFGYTLIKSIPDGSNILYEKFGDILGFIVFSYKSYIGLSIIFLDDSITFSKSIDYYLWNEYRIVLLIFQLIIILLILFFIFNQIFSPLIKLQNAVNQIKNGIYARMIHVEQEDEIGFLINNFNEMNEKISRLIKARELITRNIAHELKTPLAKIKLSLNLKEGKELKNDLNKYVDEINKISQNMFEYERIQDDKFVLKTKEYFSESVLFEAIKDLETYNININIIENVKIKCDLNLLSIAIKNLVENAIKYSDNNSLDISLSEKGMAFCNSGKKLKNDISYYFEPFYREDITKSGYGLGLSIVKEIVYLNNMKIEYKYSNGNHIFFIRF